MVSDNKPSTPVSLQGNQQKANTLSRHMVSGLSATFVEAPRQIQQNIKVPMDHLDLCKLSGTPTAGNAAGNTVNVLDLSGENKSPDPLPGGFTARGIVALVFSVVAAFVGMAVIAWYGSLPIGPSEVASAQARIAETAK